MTKIAVLGTGRMGSAVAVRLLDRGHHVTVWNRTAARAGPARQAGAEVADNPAGAARGADAVITMLTDAAAVHAVVLGPQGALAGMAPGSCLVEMSTVGPAAVADLARHLPPGLRLVDAPVGGSVAAAAAGRLRVLAGGADEAVDAVLPVLEALGSVRRCGPSGSGAAAKLVLNTALVTAITALADAVAVARSVGIGRAAALDLLAASHLAGAVTRATADGAAFPVALAGKDLDLVLAALDGTSAPVVHAAAEVLRGAADPDADIASLLPEEEHR